MKLIVTGCGGFIGSTFTYEALLKGFSVIGIDSLQNSSMKVIDKITEDFPKSFKFVKEDISSSLKLSEEAIGKEKIYAVVHFAGLKSVDESELNPLSYWHNNLLSTINILSIMKKKKINRLIFSSSATVYGNSENLPLKEDSPTMPMSAYGNTKLANEKLLEDFSRTGHCSIVSLRYFNPVGSHSLFKLYEDPLGKTTNIMPKIIRTALKIDKKLYVFGSDYNTKDGTGERDYIHISDLVDGHFKALAYLENEKGFNLFNLGNGKSVSVKEIISCFEKVNEIRIDYEEVGRRAGDIAISFADSSKAQQSMRWRPKKNLEDMCKDSWSAIVKNLNEII